MKVYLFPYGVGEIVGAPGSRNWLVRFPDGITRECARIECLIWTGK